MGRQWSTRKGNYILKSNLPIGVQNMTLKSIVNLVYSENMAPVCVTTFLFEVSTIRVQQ